MRIWKKTKRHCFTYVILYLANRTDYHLGNPWQAWEHRDIWSLLRLGTMWNIGLRARQHRSIYLVDMQHQGCSCDVTSQDSIGRRPRIRPPHHARRARSCQVYSPSVFSSPLPYLSLCSWPSCLCGPLRPYHELGYEQYPAVLC